jgi:hypothetical protein
VPKWNSRFAPDSFCGKLKVLTAYTIAAIIMKPFAPMSLDLHCLVASRLSRNCHDDQAEACSLLEGNSILDRTVRAADRME